jgi:hypothetical protein
VSLFFFKERFNKVLVLLYWAGLRQVKFGPLSPCKISWCCAIKTRFSSWTIPKFGACFIRLKLREEQKRLEAEAENRHIFLYQLQLFNSASDKNSVFFTHKDQPCPIRTDKKSGKIFLMYKDSEEIGCKVRYEEGLHNMRGNARIICYTVYMRKPYLVVWFRTRSLSNFPIFFNSVEVSTQL